MLINKKINKYLHQKIKRINNSSKNKSKFIIIKQLKHQHQKKYKNNRKKKRLKYKKNN
jgi:hypothetical protein